MMAKKNTKNCKVCKKKLLVENFYVKKNTCKSCCLKITKEKRHNKEKNKSNKRGKGKLSKVSHICKYCNKEFFAKPLKRQREYCCKECQLNAARESRVSVKKRSLCLICNEEYAHYGERVVCGRKCLAKYMSQTRIGENNPAFNSDKEICSTCDQCGKEFVYTRSGMKKTCKKKRFCSLKCMHEFAKGRVHFGPDAQFDTNYPHEFNQLKDTIRSRDNLVCQICGDKENKTNHSVHHIDYNKKNNDTHNLILLCKRCHGITNVQRSFWEIFFSAMLSGSKIVKKGWGVEVWITNNEHYCMKYLIFFAGKEFSFHKHKLKKELWHCLLGGFECVLQGDGLNKEYCIIKKGEKIEIETNLKHQLRALENSIIVEVSTQHFDTDSYRLIKGD